jgi:hypothetical protein
MRSLNGAGPCRHAASADRIHASMLNSARSSLYRKLTTMSML